METHTMVTRFRAACGQKRTIVMNICTGEG
jgi:hypothetical protein